MYEFNKTRLSYDFCQIEPKNFTGIQLEKYLRENGQTAYWPYLTRNKSLSEEFIEEFAEFVDWIQISKKQILSDQFIIKFRDKINWMALSMNPNLSESTIDIFKDKLDWLLISGRYKIGAYFIEKYADRLNKIQVCRNPSIKDIDPIFLAKYGISVDLDYVNRMQEIGKFSSSTITDMINHIRNNEIPRNQLF